MKLEDQLLEMYAIDIIILYNTGMLGNKKDLIDDLKNTFAFNTECPHFFGSINEQPTQF